MKTKRTRIINHNGYIAVITALALTLGSCGEKKSKQQDTEVSATQEIEQAKEQPADIADASFSDGMTGKIFHNYQQIRMALVNSDVDGVQTAAQNLAESFSEEQKVDLKLTAFDMWDTDDLEKQRELFSQFTEKIEPMFKESITEGIIYKQFCPMAFEGKGGYWISNLDEIRNPYYGNKMLKCGKVVEEIR